MCTKIAPFLLLSMVFLVACQPSISEKKSTHVDTQAPSSLVLSPDTILPPGAVPANITRTIIQDRRGDIWFATFEGMIKYNGKVFTNTTKKVSEVRFFAALEDRNSNLWFGTIGEGVYKYDGTSFQNLTTKDGLLNNEVTSIYEDQTGVIWFGVNGGVSRYDKQVFRNYVIKDRSMTEAAPSEIIPNFRRPPLEVNAILEDDTGNLWFATRGNTFLYDGATFTIVEHQGKPFYNVRWLMKDQNGQIWLGGKDGLWMYDGIAFEQVSEDFINYILEDRGGTIWTTSMAAGGHALSRYDINPTNQRIGAAIVKKQTSEMLFGMLEDLNGHIWIGTLNGVLRYDGATFSDFKE